MKTAEFLDILEQRKLVSQDVVDKLRAKARKDEKRVTPGAILKYLVKKDLIERKVAKKLLANTLNVSRNAESSIMGSMPLPPVETVGRSSDQTVTDDDVPTLAPLSSKSGPAKKSSPASPAETSNVFDDGGYASEAVGELASLSAAARAEEPFGEGLDSEATSTTKSKRRQKKKNEWDSSLILLGGGGLLVLLLAGVTIAYLLGRENADVVLEEASNYFDSGSYTQAIGQYERFVENFSGHPEYSDAKVKLGMARLWKDTSNTTNYETALATAKRVLEDIEDEEEFRSAQRDLASLLPKIAQGLARQAEEATDPEVIEQRTHQAREALALSNNTKYVPATFRDEVLLGEVEQTLERVRRSREQEENLVQALEEMQKAIDERRVTEAYQVRSMLLEEHPALVRSERLAAKVGEISAAEAGVVTFEKEPLSAETSPRDSAIVAALALADRRGPDGATASGTNVAVRVAGAIYGLDSGNGSLRWRHFVGNDARLRAVPLAGGDVLVVHQQDQELQRLAGETGKLAWRLPLEAELLTPVVHEDRAFVADRSGKLHIVELDKGERTGYVRFGQALAAPPTIDANREKLYIPGEHSSLYTISLDDFTCDGVYYLGHAPGNVVVPVAKVLSKVVAAVNTGASSGRLRVLATNADGLPVAEDTSVRFVGLVNTDLMQDGRRLGVITSRGQISVMDVTPNEGNAAISLVAARDAERGDLVAHYGLLREGHVWSAAGELSKLAILPTGNQLRVQNLEQTFGGDTFDYPLVSLEGTILHVRRPAGQAGYVVAATAADSGRVLWETELAVPPAGPPAVDSETTRISAVSASGAAFVLDRESMSRRVEGNATRVAVGSRRAPPLTEVVDLRQGRLAASTAGAETILHFRPGAGRQALSAIDLPSPLVGGLARMRDGIVAPTRIGQVFLFAGDSGEQLGSPFQPSLEAGTEYRWLKPAVYGEGDEAQLIVSDGQDKIYLVTFSGGESPHLEARAEATLESILVTQLAVCGDHVAAGTENQGLAVFPLPSLGDAATIDLGGRVTWGPFAVGNHLLMTTDAGKMICCNETGEIAWRQPLERGEALGEPLASDADFLMLWQGAGISRVSVDDGREIAHVPIEQVPAAGPVGFGRRVVVAAADGTLLVLDRP